jgi:hypothetical protein
MDPTEKLPPTLVRRVSWTGWVEEQPGQAGQGQQGTHPCMVRSGSWLQLGKFDIGNDSLQVKEMVE